MNPSPARRPRSPRLAACRRARTLPAARWPQGSRCCWRLPLRCGARERGAGRGVGGRRRRLLPIPPLTARVTDLTRTLSAAEQQALEAKLADWEARRPPARGADGAHDAARADRSLLDPGRRCVEDRPQGQRQRRAAPDRQERPEDAHRGRLRPGRDADRRHLAPDHRRKRRAAVPRGKFAAGIDAGVDRIISVVAEGKPLPPPPSRAAPARQSAASISNRGSFPLLVLVTVCGGILRAIFGKAAGRDDRRRIIGTAAWFVVGSLVIAIRRGDRRLPRRSSSRGRAPGRGRGPMSSGGGWGRRLLRRRRPVAAP